MRKVLAFLLLSACLFAMQGESVQLLGSRILTVAGGGGNDISFANLGTSANPDFNVTTNAASYANTSWTPPSSGLIVVFASHRPQQTITSITGNSITWVEIVTIGGGAARRITLFGANASGSTTGATTITMSAATNQMVASFFHVTGVDLSGGVAAAFVQTGTSTGTATSGSVTLAAAGNSNNRPIIGCSWAANEAGTPRVNWTEADDLGNASPAAAVETQWRSDAFETTADATWTTSSEFVCIAAELLD